MTLSFAVLSNKLSKPRHTETEYIYVYIEPDESSTEADTENSDKIWTVKDLDGQICIFNSDGTIYKKLDTYIKTLPKEEQDLLREGMEIYSEHELYSIIEAYTD